MTTVISLRLILIKDSLMRESGISASSCNVILNCMIYLWLSQVGLPPENDARYNLTKRGAGLAPVLGMISKLRFAL